MATTRILVVDDEEDLCEILKFNLEIEGYDVDTAFSAEDALKLDISSYNLLLLDVMMGEISGFKLANMLRKNEKTAKMPIIFLTAKDTENDLLTGFNLGADDYITKPFSPRELVARVAAILRRSSEKDPLFSKMSWNDSDLEIDIIASTVRKSGSSVSLTPSEYRILLALIKHPGRTFTREELIALGKRFNVQPLQSALDLYQ